MPRSHLHITLAARFKRCSWSDLGCPRVHHGRCTSEREGQCHFPQYLAPNRRDLSPAEWIIVGAILGHSPGNKRVSRLFPVTTDGVKRPPLLGTYPELPLAARSSQCRLTD